MKQGSGVEFDAREKVFRYGDFEADVCSGATRQVCRVQITFIFRKKEIFYLAIQEIQKYKYIPQTIENKCAVPYHGAL